MILIDDLTGLAHNITTTAHTKKGRKNRKLNMPD